MERINFLSDWQKNIQSGLGEVIFREKCINSVLQAELIMSTNQFDCIVNFYLDDHFQTIEDIKNLNSNSVIYKYLKRSYISGKEEYWATYNEVKIDNIQEFLDDIMNVEENYEGIKLVENEYKAIVKMCKSVVENKNQLFFIADNY